MSCNCGKPKCNGKCGISPAVLQINNPDECTLFHKVTVPASMGDSKTNPPKNGDYKNVLLYFEADKTSWLFSSDGIPTQLVSGMTNYEDAQNLPSINNHTLMGNMSGSDLDLQDKLTAGDNIQITGTTISATDTTYDDFVGATPDAAGEAGLVPAPASGVTEKFLKSDGTWSDTTAFLPYPASVNTSGTTQQFIASIQALNAEVGTAFLGTVSLTDLPESMAQEEVMAYVYDNNLIYLTLRSADVAPYIWSCNSYAYRGWEPIDTTAVTVLWANSTESGATRHLYADTSMFDAVSMGDIITAAHKGLIFVRLANPLTPEQYDEYVLVNIWVSPDDNDYQAIFTNGNYTRNYGADALTDTAFAYSSGQYQRKLTAGAGINIAGNTISVKDWEKFARTFDTVAIMKAADLSAGEYARTGGYYAVNDGGSALYKIRTITSDDTVDEAFIIEITSDPSSTLVAELILNNEINVNQIGAKGDGETDDTTALQSAINFAQTSGIPIQFMPKTYLLSKVVTTAPVYLIGNDTTLKSVDSNLNDALIYMENDGSINSVIEGIKFDGNKENVSNELCAIKICNTAWRDTHTRFENLEIKNFSGNGIVLTGTATHNDVRELKMHKLSIHHCDLNGIMADSLTDSILTNSSIWHNGKSGLYLYIAGSIRVDNCKFHWNGFNGNEQIALARIPASAFEVTSDASAQAGKTYYTRSGYGDWQSPYVFTAHTGEFAPDTTYYEVDRSKYIEKFNGIRIDQCTNIMVTSTEIQDNFGDGIWVNGGNQNSFVNVCVDNNGLLADIETHQVYTYASYGIVQFYYGVYITGSYYANMLLEANNFRYNTYGYMQAAGVKMISTENVNITMTSRLQVRLIDLEDVKLKLTSITINGMPYKVYIPKRLLTLAEGYVLADNDWNGSFIYAVNGTVKFKVIVRKSSGTIPTSDNFNPIQFPSIINPPYTVVPFSFTCDNLNQLDKVQHIPIYSYVNKNGKIIFETTDSSQQVITLQGEYDLA